MSGPILSHPFRFGSDGRAATVDQDSPLGHAQQIHAIVSTRLGERHMTPSFGLRDPVFVGVEASDISSVIALHYPNAGFKVSGVQVAQIDDGSVVSVAFEEVPR